MEDKHTTTHEVFPDVRGLLEHLEKYISSRGLTYSDSIEYLIEALEEESEL